MSSDKIQLYKEYFGPPKVWELKDAKEYREALRGLPACKKGVKPNKGQLRRFAPIGNIDMSDSSIPKSFPFYKFSDDVREPSDDEILRRGNQILQMLNKYDPYADTTFMNAKFENVEIPDISLLDELMKPEVRPKDPVVAYLQSLPEKPGPRLNIKSDANSYQTAGYDIDRLVNWINVPQKDSDIAGVHRALILNAGNYLLQLSLEHEKDKECIKDCIDYELKQYMRYGTNGKYVHRYNINAVVDAMDDRPNKGTKSVKIVSSERDPKTGRWRDTSRYEDRAMSEKSWLLDGVIVDDATYKMFNKVLDIDAKGHKKWKKYIKRKMKLYNRYMSKTYKGNRDTSKWTGGSDSDYQFNRVSSGAALRARVVSSRKRPPRKPPSPPPKPPTPPPSPKPIAKAKPTTPASQVEIKATAPLPIESLTDEEIQQKIEELRSLNTTYNDELRRISGTDQEQYSDKLIAAMGQQNKEITNLQNELDRRKATAPVVVPPVEGDDPLSSSDSQGAIDLEPEPEPKFKVGDCVLYDVTKIGTVESVNVTTSQVDIRPYTAPGDVELPTETKPIEEVESLSVEDCDKAVFEVNITFKTKVQQQEAERKRKEEVAKKYGFKLTSHNLDLYGYCEDCK